MRLSAKVAYNTIVQTASKLVSVVLGLAAVALMTRYLGQVGFGEYITIITFLSFFGIIADLGLTLVTARMLSEPGADEEKITGNLLGLRLVTAVVFLALAPLLVQFFPYPPLVKLGVLITTLSYLFIALNQVLVGLFQKHLRLDKVSIAEVASRLALVAGVILVVRLDGGLVGIMVASVLASAISFILHFVFSLKFVRIKLRFNFSLWRGIIAKSWPLALTIIFNLIYLKTDTLFLSIIKRPSAIGIIAEVGIYGAAYRVIDVLVIFPFMFAGLILPILTRLWTNKDKEKFQLVTQKAFNLLMLLALPLVIGTQFVARDVMMLVAGNDFALSGPVLRILIFAAGLIYFGSIFSHGIIAIDRQKDVIWAYAFTAVTAVIGYYILIPRFSYFGAAWVTIYSELIIAVIPAVILYYHTKFIPRFDIALKALFASLVMAAALYYLHNFNLVIMLTTAVIAYFAALFLVGGIKKDEIKELLLIN